MFNIKEFEPSEPKTGNQYEKQYLDFMKHIH